MAALAELRGRRHVCATSLSIVVARDGRHEPQGILFVQRHVPQLLHGEPIAGDAEGIIQEEACRAVFDVYKRWVTDELQ